MMENKDGMLRGFVCISKEKPHATAGRSQEDLVPPLHPPARPPPSHPYNRISDPAWPSPAANSKSVSQTPGSATPDVLLKILLLFFFFSPPIKAPPLPSPAHYSVTTCDMTAYSKCPCVQRPGGSPSGGGGSLLFIEEGEEGGVNMKKKTKKTT